jgi:tRNA(fMet)-specific endonuclease VapC
LITGREEEPFGISVVTAAELLHGVERVDAEARRVKRQSFVEKVLELFPIFPFDTGVARIYARIWANLARKGQVVGAHDLIIAATALSLDYAVMPPTAETSNGSRDSGWKSAARASDRMAIARWRR